MKDLLDAAQAALDAVRAASSGRRPDALTSGELVATSAALGVLRRAVDAAHLPVAAEIARQSRADLGRDSLARKHGFRTAAGMISAETGAGVGEAARMISVGEATVPRLSLAGEEMPARHPHVAAALTSAAIGVLAASAIVTMFDRVALRADRGLLDEAEAMLVAAAPGLGLDQLQKLILRAEAYLDPDGVEPREDEARADRSLTIRQGRDGMVLFRGRFDAETAAPVVAAVEGLVGGMLRRREIAADGAEDARSVSQMRADALADICRHATGCEAVPTGPASTVVVRMSLADLQAGTGAAMIDGIAAPISVAAARRLAADGQIIPCVLGDESEILDWGRAKRLFTPAQKLALAERDGGCAFCGLPPSMTVAHHIRWWERDAGPTDLGNGILLCTSCHHRIHDDGWEIRVDGRGTSAKVWFVPPAWLDAARTPRLGGRARFDLAA